MLAIDLDGTLLGPNGAVSAANVAAVAKAQAAGILVTPCTGRGWRESAAVLRGVFDRGPGVFISGAMISELATGWSLDLAVLESHLVGQLVELLRDLPEALLVYRDAALVGHDYLVTGRGTLSPNTQWWLETTGATVHFARELGPEHLRHCVRVALVANSNRVGEIRAWVIKHLGDSVSLHSFEAVQKPDPNETEHIVEIFARGVDKWRGLQWLARQREIPTDAIAAIGDQVNDLAMIRAAGCGIAMGNAIAPVKEAARFVSRGHHEDGVAYAIEQLLSGAWK